jgi:hypothetical protein
MRVTVVGATVWRACAFAQRWLEYVRSTGRLGPGTPGRWRVAPPARVDDEGCTLRIDPAFSFLEPIHVCLYSFAGIVSSERRSSIAKADVLVVLADGKSGLRMDEWFDDLVEAFRAAGGRRVDARVALAGILIVGAGMDPDEAEAIQIRMENQLSGWERPPLDAEDEAKALCTALTTLHPDALTPGFSGGFARTPARWLVAWAAVVWVFCIVIPAPGFAVVGGVCRAVGFAACARAAGAAPAEIGTLDPWVLISALIVAAALYVTVQLVGRWRAPSHAASLKSISPESRFRVLAAAALAGAWAMVLWPRSVLLAVVAAVQSLRLDVPTGLLLSALDASNWRLPAVAGALAISLLVLALMQYEVWRLPGRLWRLRVRASMASGSAV